MPFQVEKTPYGIRTSHSGFATTAEATQWLADCKRALGEPHSFGQLVDLRGQKANSPETNEIIQRHMKWIRGHGLVRSAVVLSSAVTALQIKRLAKETGMYDFERYFSPETDPDWEQKALDWIEKGVDPDFSRPTQRAP
jgi:hypothetical protein